MKATATQQYPKATHTWLEWKAQNHEAMESWIDTMTQYGSELPKGAKVLIDTVEKYRQQAIKQVNEHTVDRIYAMPEMITVEPVTNEAVMNDESHYSKFVYERFGPKETWNGRGFREEDWNITEKMEEDPKYCIVKVKMGETYINLGEGQEEFPATGLEYKFVRKLR